MKKDFNFSEEFGKIDETLIGEAGKPWTVERSRILKLYRRKIVQAAAIILIFIAAAGNSQVQAAIKRFTTKIGEMFWFSKDLSAYTEIINQTQTKNGISLTINEVILDDYGLIVSVKTDYGDRRESPYLWINDEKTLINGQRYQSISSIVGGQMDLEALGEYEMDTDTVLVQEYEDIELPDGEVEVHLVLEAGEQVPIFQEGRSEGSTEFVYDFSITAEQLKAQTVQKEVNMEIPGVDGCSLILKELVMNDLRSRIVVSGVESMDWWDRWSSEYEVKLKGQDSFGNPVSFGLVGAAFSSENELWFETSFFGDYEDAAVADEDSFQMSVPDKNCTYLDLQLYQRKLLWDPETAEKVDDEYDMQESLDPGEGYSEEDNYGWEPVGDVFRIQIK